MLLSKAEIERRAGALRREHLGHDDVPVDVERIVHDLGGTIEVQFGGYRDRESLAVAHDGSFTVYVPSNTSMLRDRFTIAHELGHLQLHHNSSLGKPASFERYGRNRRETEANAFAGALLMPEVPFRAAWKALQGDLWAIARKFQVSQSAAGVRCQVLGLD